MTAKIAWKDAEGIDIEITNGAVQQDDGLATLIYLSLFTDARANNSDEIPDGTTDRRGWPGDTYVSTEWGSRLWLLDREKLTNEVRRRAADYATEALNKLKAAGYIKTVSVVGTIPKLNTLVLNITLTKPDGSPLALTISKRWEAQYAV